MKLALTTEETERLWSKIAKAGPDECWLWTAAGANSNGRGRFKLRRKLHLPYRLVYQSVFGPIPEGHDIRHTCDEGRCCNPKHIITGTRKQNVDDMFERDRAALGEKHGFAKLTEEDVHWIRVSPLNNAELGRLLGVDRKTVASVREGKTWTHVPTKSG